jgi:ribonuclease Z
MPTLIYLGTGAAVPSPGRDNTSLAIDDGTEVTIVDTSAAPLKRLVEAGLAPERLARVIITHKHLDHTYGLPSLAQALWLVGRTEPLPIYAGAETWEFLDRLVDVFRPSSWIDAFPLERHEITPGERPFLETASFSVRAAPGEHSVPSLGLRFELSSGRTLVYSSDTKPCDSITELARDADLLIHEATYLAGMEEHANRYGHSSSRQAAEVARAAGANVLTLIHHTPRAPGDLDRLRDGAAEFFPGPIHVPNDFDRTELD